MRQVGGDTGGVDDIVEGELVNERGELEEQRQRLVCVASVCCFPPALWGTPYLSNTARGTGNDCQECQDRAA